MKYTFALRVTTRKDPDKIKTILFHEASREQWQQRSLDKLHSRKKRAHDRWAENGSSFHTSIQGSGELPETGRPCGYEEKSQPFTGWLARGLNWESQFHESICPAFPTYRRQQQERGWWAKGNHRVLGIFTMIGLQGQNWTQYVWNLSKPLPAQIPTRSKRLQCSLIHNICNSLSLSFSAASLPLLLSLYRYKYNYRWKMWESRNVIIKRKFRWHRSRPRDSCWN